MKLAKSNPNPTQLEVGMGVTISIGSDRVPATIIKVYTSGRRILLQGDAAIRQDKNGMSESQTYSYSRDLKGKIYIATLRKGGHFIVSKSSMFVTLGVRRKYYDYSF
jgi:hypothetical protein